MSAPLFSDRMVFDVETSVIAGARQFLGQIQAPSNYKKQESIDKYVAEATAKEESDAALDPDLCRLVSIAWWNEHDTGPLGYIAKDEDEERVMLMRFAKRIRSDAGGLKTLVGFNILDFDVVVLMRRALYLDVPFPVIQVDRFRHPSIIDLMQELSYGGKLRYRKLDFYCKRFGIDVEDPHTGADVPRLAAMKDYMSILAHCKADVRKERLLAERLGILKPAPVAAP